jgi:Domain of unknown function (DUF4424)
MTPAHAHVYRDGEERVMARLKSYVIAIVSGAILGGAMLAAVSTAHANDSTAELSIGGLQFAPTNDIAMQHEDLRISPDRVSVRYQLTNSSAKPVTLTIAFPLPDIDLADAENVALPSADPINFVDFETRIDDAPAPFRIEQRATLGDRDVSAVLDQFKLPVMPIGRREIRLADLPEATRAKLVDQGLLVPERTDDKGRQHYAIAWVAKTSALRQQTFPPGHAVIVEHQYQPSVGISSDTILRRFLRDNKALSSEVERYRKEYCISDAFLAQLDARAGNGELNASMIGEQRINYVLKTGADGATPVGSFKLTIDPGPGDRLVSFCPGRLRPTAPDALEFTAKDFTPEGDLKVLIIGRF